MQAEHDRWATACAPIDPMELGRQLDATLEVFAPLPGNWSEVAGFYVEALEDVPRDLVEKALRHVRLTCTFFPKPAEFRKPIAEELSERRATTTRLGTILKVGQFREDYG